METMFNYLDPICRIPHKSFLNVSKGKRTHGFQRKEFIIMMVFPMTLPKLWERYASLGFTYIMIFERGRALVLLNMGPQESNIAVHEFFRIPMQKDDAPHRVVLDQT
ncbi:hypothetical protein PsorP6_015092 [Peronosclerospora sorghi]|uniref:Uncharacterized protein n=1 Tax=Peronosclerospora sorghi TaxID=230839 RepID=A0ACC0VR74_9STRA|nr:hypothetical protein PsorP6_015092 [Peronosclerospora sorghi]